MGIIFRSALPFLFIFNTELLMIGIESWYHLLITIATAIMAMLLFAAGTQGYFLTKSRLWESLALILVAFTLFRPGFWMDYIHPPLEAVAAKNIYSVAESLPADAQIRVQVKGEDLEGKSIDKIVMLPVGKPGKGIDRIKSAGLELREEDGKIFVDNVVFGTTAERMKIDFDYEVASVQRKADRPPKQLFYIPAIALFFFIVMLQRRRREGEGDGIATPQTA